METESQGALRPKPLRLRRKRKSPFGTSEEEEVQQEERTAQRPPFRNLPPPDLQEEEEEVGVEWCVVSRARFTSPSPLPCRFRAFEEVTGTVAFARGTHQPQGDPSSLLFQHSLVWQHPSPLPWLPPLFPRTHHPGPAALSPAAQESLHSKWCDSLRSLYQLVRLFQCPFFYMCGPHFTALFRCAGAAAFPALHALLAPTTRALRAQLAKEGVPFSMPLACADEPTAAQQDSEGEEWLESLGLSQDAFPVRRSDPRSGGGGGASLVCVEGGPAVAALVNFLACGGAPREKGGGVLSGVPPTLLAPCAFLGATLTPLQVSAGRVREGARELHSVEVRGPLLPSALLALRALLPPDPVLTPLAHTQLFTQVRPVSPIPTGAFAHTNLADCGMSREFVRRMCSTPH